MTTSHPLATEKKPGTEKADADYEREMRGWSKHLYVWGLCDNPACHRASACRAHAAALCMKAKYPRLPAGVQVWFELITTAKLHYEVSFEQILNALDQIGAKEALLAWQEAVDAGEDMRAPGAVQAFEQRCTTFAAWFKANKVEDIRQSV